VLRALQEKLMREDFFEEFCNEFTKEMNRLRMQQGASIASAKRELARIEAWKSKLINLVLDDQLPAGEAKEELLKNAKRREELEAQLRAADEPPPLLHPRMADVYRSKVAELAVALQQPDTRLEASETLRGLIDTIVLTPGEPPSRDGQDARFGAQGARLRIELRGNLAAMLTAAQQAKRSPDSGDLLMPVQLVAGACNQRYLQLWSGAA
jgi:site-specific DNA recombinase